MLSDAYSASVDADRLDSFIVDYHDFLLEQDQKNFYFDLGKEFASEDEFTKDQIGAIGAIQDFFKKKILALFSIAPVIPDASNQVFGNLTP